jgi:hypothetical protein
MLRNPGFGIFIIMMMLIIAGCSAGNASAVTIADNPNIDASITESNGNRTIIGIWDLNLNPESGVKISENRDLMAHLNVTSLLSPPGCSDCLTIGFISFDPSSNVYSFNVSIKNPTSNITAYDVRGTLLFSPSDNRKLVNADAYTTIFSGNGTCPFKAFAKGEANRKFNPGQTYTERYDILLPPPANFNIGYVIDASYPSNQEEPYAFSDTHLDGVVDDCGSSGAWLYMTVHDWQSNISQVTLNLGFTKVTMIDNGNSEYKYYLKNTVGAPTGIYPLWIEAKSSGSNYALYDKFDLTVHPCSSLAYPIVDTGQMVCYDDTDWILCPDPGEPFYGQDAQYQEIQHSFQDNGDGTITDLNTGLMWQQNSDLVNKSTFSEALAGATTFDLASYNDWRLPSIKELYSLIDFNGNSFYLIPYIDTNYFNFRWGDESQGERIIDTQYWSSTVYVGKVMNNQTAVFGVNFGDGRIKGYGLQNPTGEMHQFVRYVRSNPSYGINDFEDNGNGTITDHSTGLMWQKSDDSNVRNWEQALDYAETLDFAGHDDWRLPNPKELQSIVDYTRAPDAADPSKRTAAIDPIFTCTEMESWYWTSTTHHDGPSNGWAAYVCFGIGYGWMPPPGGGTPVYMNVHGAGCQRSDPKDGDPADWPYGNGPQGDEVRIFNYVRCVRNMNAH